jgi:predicted nucleotide-binding protein
LNISIARPFGVKSKSGISGADVQVIQHAIPLEIFAQCHLSCLFQAAVDSKESPLPDDQLPSAFIGSSTEGLDVAREVELQLQRDAVTTMWKDGVFGPTNGFLETLMNQLEQFDLAVMVLSPDDLVESRSQSSASPRDNVIFELGLFMGRLGRSRVFIVHEENADLKLPSDLAGISLLQYRKRENLSAALSPACTPIIKAIRANGFSETRTHKNLMRLEGRQKCD